MEFPFLHSHLELQNLFSIIASVLHMGNIKFEADSRGYACITSNKEIHWVSKVRLKLFQLQASQLPVMTLHALLVAM